MLLAALGLPDAEGLGAAVSEMISPRSLGRMMSTQDRDSTWACGGSASDVPCQFRCVVMSGPISGRRIKTSRILVPVAGRRLKIAMSELAYGRVECERCGC